MHAKWIGFQIIATIIDDFKHQTILYTNVRLIYNPCFWATYFKVFQHKIVNSWLAQKC